MSERLQLDPITKTFIIQAGADLPLDGQSESMRCPFCEVLHENKFSVKRVDEGFVYNCFRGKCGASGFVRSDSAFYSPTQGNAKAKKSRSYRGVESLKKLDAVDIFFFFKTWGISTFSGIYVTEADEYAFEICGPTGSRKGWHIRQPRWKNIRAVRLGDESKPKGLTYKERQEDSKSAWLVPENPETKTVVLVEDYISALKVFQAGYVAVSLFGTSITPSLAKEIANCGFCTEVVLWLDADAKNQAFDQIKRWGVLLNIRLMQSRSDPKDLSEEFIKEVL